MIAYAWMSTILAVAVPNVATASTAPATLEARTTLAARLDALREKPVVRLRAAEPDKDSSAPDRVAQWGNWANYWGNWPNWRNW